MMKIMLRSIPQEISAKMETIIRSANGDHYADSNLHKAQRLHEDLLRIEGEIRESMDQLMEARNDKDTLIKESPFLFCQGTNRAQ